MYKNLGLLLLQMCFTSFLIMALCELMPHFMHADIIAISKCR